MLAFSKTFSDGLTAVLAGRLAGYVPLSGVHVADLLCFRGSHPVSAAIRDIDGCRYDHPGIVVEVNADGIWFAEQNFDGYRIARLNDYDDDPEEILVRRPRTPGSERFLHEALEEFAATKPTYAWDRLVDIVLVSLVRCVPMFEQYNDEQKDRLAEKLGLLFGTGSATVGMAKTAVCVDPMVAVNNRQEPGANGKAWSLTRPVRPIGSLEDWRSSLSRLIEMLAQHTKPGVDPLGYLRALVDAAGVGGLETPLHQAVEAYLLDKLLRQGEVLTPYDIVMSPSFFDVGLLDPSLYRSALVAT